MDETGKPIVAMLHATLAAVAPAQSAFAQDCPDARLWNIIDDRLVDDAEREGTVTPALRRRMTALIEYATAGGADAVQLTCSMYGIVASDARGLVPVRAPDQAMFDEIARIRPSRLAVVGSLAPAVSDSVTRLRARLTPNQTDDTRVIIPVVVQGASAASGAGDRSLLVELLLAETTRLARDVDAVALAQYSLTLVHSELQAATPIPVLSPAHLAAQALRRALGGGPNP